MTEIKELIISTIAEPAQVKLIRYAKGYGWEINLHGESMAKVAEEVSRIDALYKERYGQQQPEIKEVKQA